MPKEPNWNRKPEPSEPISQELKVEPEPQEPLYMNRNHTIPLKLGGEKNNKHEQLLGVVPGMGGGVKFVYVLPFSWGERETHKQISQEISGNCRDSPGTVPRIIPGQSRENFVYVFSSSLVFSGPEKLC